MKVLILSCNTGGGHNTAAKAILEEFRRRNIYCQMVDTLSFGKPYTSKIVSGSYISIAKKTPKIFGKLYHAGDIISSPKRKSPVYYANKLYSKKLGEFINKNNFDTIVCPHLFPAQAVTSLILRNIVNIKLYAVATDYTCSPFWEETKFDKFFIPHIDLIAEFIKKGISSDKLLVTGIPVSTKFSQHIDKYNARKQLNLPIDKRIYVIMTGSMGFGKVTVLPKLICEKDKNCKILVLVGSNEKLQKHLNESYSNNSSVETVSFTDKVELYMRSADVLLTKPGGLTSTEAIVSNVPLIHTYPIPGCETKNANFFSSKNMSQYAVDNEVIAELSKNLMDDYNLQQDMILAQQKNSNPNAVIDICNYIVSH